MCIYLGSGYFLMTQHTLDSPEIGASLQKMGGKGVAECMRTYRFVNSGHCREILDDIKNHYP